MGLKKEAKKLKTFAKELGYDIKLTHAQEILARMDGHKTRHSLLLKEKQELEQTLKEQKERENDPFFYYEIYVSFGGNEGYSCFFKSTEHSILEQDIVDLAIKLGKFDETDCGYIVYAEEMDREFYPNNE